MRPRTPLTLPSILITVISVVTEITKIVRPFAAVRWRRHDGSPFQSSFLGDDVVTGFCPLRSRKDGDPRGGRPATYRARAEACVPPALPRYECGFILHDAWAS